VPIVNGSANNDIWSTTSAGAYTVMGLEGNDNLRIKTSRFASGDAGDLLDGGAGNDYLSAVHTNDTLLGGAGFDQLLAGDGNDSLDGGDDGDLLDAGSGNDTLLGGSGADTLLGGFGNDSFDGGDGNDLITTSSGDHGGVRDSLGSLISVDVLVKGGGGDDQIVAATGSDGIDGGDGNDTLTLGGDDDKGIGGAGNDNIYGGSGGDTIDGGAGDDVMDGGDGVDKLSYLTALAGVIVDLALTNQQNTGGGGLDALSGFEILEGSNFADTLSGNDANNGLEGEDGDDILDGRGGADQLLGGNGSDTVDYTASTAAVTINLADGATEQGGHAEGDTLNSIENIRGSAFDDSLTGDDGDNQLDGRGGADQIIGGNGVDTAVYAGSPEAVAINLADGVAESGGDAQGDTLTSVENIVGSEFSDSLTGDDNSNRLDGRGGADQLAGGNGVDIADYTGSPAAITINLADGVPESGGYAEGDTLTSMEIVWGSAFADSLAGDANANQLEGRDGNDTIAGAGGNDILYGGLDDDSLSGGDGNDALRGGAGADQMDGGVGTDSVSYSDSAGAVAVNLQLGTGTGGDAAGDVFVLGTIENVFGSSFSDTLTGNAGTNQLTGNAGNDTIAGGAGRDVLLGGTSTSTSTDVDTFDYNSLSELERTTTLGAWDTIYGFTGSSSVTGRDFLDLSDLFDSAGLGSVANTSAAAVGGYIGIRGVSIGGISSTFIFFDPNGGADADGSGPNFGTFGDGDDYLVAGFVGTTQWTLSSILV